MLYEPIKLRVNGFSEGMLDFYLKRQYNPEFPMGNIGASQIATVIQAWLLGLHVEISPVLPRALQWVDKAIVDDEKFGDLYGHRTTLHWAKANEIVRSGLDDYMAFAYQAGEYDEGFKAGIDMYERWTGKSGPVSLSKVLKPREFGYALCLHRTCRQQFEEEDLLKAGQKMLQANLQETWLGGGQYIRAATWLKIVYWHHDETLTPLQTILKAYDNMPKVPRPGFVVDC